jgi:hypothetical protein
LSLRSATSMSLSVPYPTHEKKASPRLVQTRDQFSTIIGSRPHHIGRGGHLLGCRRRGLSSALRTTMREKQDEVRQAKLLTSDEARLIAVNTGRLLKLFGKVDRNRTEVGPPGL